MSLESELAEFYRRCGFGTAIGKRPKTVPVFTGCLLVPLPNIETRRRYLKYHDLHHLVTGYSVGRIGEGEVSAWELGTGSMFISPMLGFMNLIALSTGLILVPRRMWRAFLRGCASRNLYSAAARAAVEKGRWLDVASLSAELLETRGRKAPSMVRTAEFAAYAMMAMTIHFLIAGPAVITRLVTDIALGYSIFQAVKLKKRTDLY